MNRSALALGALVTLGACESDQEIVGPDLEDGFFHDFEHPGTPIADISVTPTSDGRYPKADGEEAFDRFEINMGRDTDYGDLETYIRRYLYMVTGHFGDRLGEGAEAMRPNAVDVDGKYTGVTEWHYDVARSSDEVWMAFLEREFSGDELTDNYSLVPVSIGDQHYMGGRYSIYVDVDGNLVVESNFRDVLESLGPERE